MTLLPLSRSAALRLVATLMTMALLMAVLLWTFSVDDRTGLQASPRADTRTVETARSMGLRVNQSMTNDTDPRLQPIQPIQEEPTEQESSRRTSR
jgi:hypothetical protein